MENCKLDSGLLTTSEANISDATSSELLHGPPKLPCRHMYTNEEYRFIWYHRRTLGMSASITHQKFHEYFKPTVKVSIDGLNQLVARLGRTLPDVLQVVNTEAWATPRSLPKNEEDQNTEIEDILPKTDSSSTIQRKQEESGADEGTEISPAPESAPSAPKRPRHMYTNEQHRFIWFYRSELKMGAEEAAMMFNDYFGLSQTSSALNQLSGRLKKTMPPDVVNRRHTEPWATSREGKR